MGLIELQNENVHGAGNHSKLNRYSVEINIVMNIKRRRDQREIDLEEENIISVTKNLKNNDAENIIKRIGKMY